MATFTITSNTDIDTLSGKGGDDAYNMNGATLTIASDSRWGVNATDTTGPFGTMTLNSALGGNVLFDGTQVWWLKYDNGSGNVPAKAATITGATSGATGELIGVWSAINTTPTTAGSAMPATGYIKLKTKTGTFQDNESLTSGGAIGDVNSSTGGQRGFLELVGVETRAVTIPRLGEFRATGDWFELEDVTSGTPGQIVQLPNSGGTNTFYPGIEIETGSGTGVFEQYPAIYAPGSSGWNNTNMGTDSRCKFVEMLDNGRIRIGTDGTNNVGYTPAAGLRMRIPNLIFQCTTNANRAINVVPNVTVTPRYGFATGLGGNVIIDKAIFAWYFNVSQPYEVDINDMMYFDYVFFANPVVNGTINKVCNGNYAHFANAVFTMNNASNGFTISNCKFGKTGAVAVSSVNIALCTDIIYTGNITGPRLHRTVQNQYADAFTTCYNVTYSNNTTIGNGYNFATSNNIEVTNHTYFDRYLGNTTTLVGCYAGVFISTSDFSVSGLTLDTAFGQVAPYLALYYTSGSLRGKIRNLGTYASPLNLNATNGSGYIVLLSGSMNDVMLQRVYTINTRLSIISAGNTNNRIYCENVFGDYADAQRYLNLNNYFRGCGMANSALGEASVYGVHFNDFHTSTTAGAVNLVFDEKTAEEPSASSYTITGGTPRFTSATTVFMPSLTDEIVYEMQYYAIGHTGFQNVNPTRTGTSTGNFTLEYDIDVNDGNGFSGSWTAMTGANLSAETISATLGFKLRIKISVNTAAASNTLGNLLIPTTSTTTTQAYQYPLDNYTLTFAGLETGSKIAVLSPGTETLLEMLTESGGSATFDFNSDQSGTTIDYAILAPGFEYIRENGYVLPTKNTTLNFVQVPDIVYDAAETALVTFDGSTHTIQMDAGSTELNVVGMYAEYIDWAMLSNNLRFDFAFTGAGGNDIDPIAGTSIPKYAFLTNGWRISPDEANHQLDVTTGILVVDGGGNPFNNTVGGYNVQINYQQPVQAITVNTSSTPPGLTLNQFLALK